VNPQLLLGMVSTLREIDPRYLKQPDRADLRVRYFRGQAIELHVWQTLDGSLDHFQLVVGAQALIWSLRRGFLLGEAEQDPRGPGSTGMLPAAEIIFATTEVKGMGQVLAAVVDHGPLDDDLRRRLKAVLLQLPDRSPH
jgi:hypothetical protein